MNDEVAPVTDDELLYRRIPASTGWYDERTGYLSPQAFGPHKERDQTGLSVSRARFRGSERDEALRGRPGKTYYVAVLRAGELRRCGIEVEARPQTPVGYDRAHAELSDLRSETRKWNETLQRQELLAEELCIRVEGPFTVPES